MNMDNLEKLMEVASLFGKVPKIHVYNSSRGHYRCTNNAYKSALRPAPISAKDKSTTETLSHSSSILEFKYSPLSRESGQMRLVTLLPRSQHGTELCCTLDHVSLNDSPSYCALSYTWGNPAATKPIILNGRCALITKNLDVALRNLQHENEGLVLWIDSLCINQDDVSEKMHQVQQMASIYSSAAIVLAWLGPGSVESDFAIYKLDDLSCRHMEMMLRVSASKEPVEALMYKELAGLVDSLKVGSEPDCDVPILAISKLLQREYWTRVWIQQEIALARDIMFVCGNTDIDRRHLAPALKVCMFCTSFLSRGSLTSRAGHWDLVGLAAYIPDVLALDHKPEERSLTELLLKLKSGKGHLLAASDSKDYVYGFLGLASRESTFGIVPNYAVTTAQLYTELSQAILKSGDVDLLRCAGGDRSNSEIKHLASWVVDWSLKQHSPMDVSIAPGKATPCFSASDSHTSSCEFPSKGTLRLSGVQVDTIQTIGPTWEYQTDLNESTRQKYASFVQELETLYETADDEDEEYGFKSTWRVPIVDIEGISSSSFSSLADRQIIRRATEEYSLAGFSALVGYDGLLETLSPTERDKAYSYLRFMNDHANSRPTFVTKGGLIGMANSKNFDLTLRSKDGLVGVGDTKEVEPGDILCIFLGASIPFILRGEADGRYRLVCDAYVQGIMDGEIMRKEPTVREFDII